MFLLDRRMSQFVALQPMPVEHPKDTPQRHRKRLNRAPVIEMQLDESFKVGDRVTSEKGNDY